MCDWLWLDAAPPTVPGWYATIHCWDTHEGQFPSAHYWDGVAWDAVLPFSRRSPQPFAVKEQAKAWAEQHDPEVITKQKKETAHR
jgi:hypothetical protein